MGICTSCNKSTAQDEQHNCNADYVLLGTSDWKVLRHNDQIALGVPTTLTPEEFTALLSDRQAARTRLQGA